VNVKEAYIVGNINWGYQWHTPFSSRSHISHFLKMLSLVKKDFF